MARKLQFIFFDVGSTLLFANRERMLAPLHARGIRPSEDQLLTLERTVKNQFDDILEHDGKADHGFWELFYARLFEELGLRDEPLRRVVIANTRNSLNWDRIRPGTREALDRIGAKYGIAVISNADGRIAELLARRGIADCFRSITDSGIVGQEKPHRVIFETALASVGASAEQSLYVGDVYSVDYRGATEVEMDGVLFDVCGAYRDKGLPRVESLEELAVLLDCERKSDTSSAPGGAADIDPLRHR
jgi:putative hydrolase of the HAD superfamily